jgi:hypothetical protein
MKLLREEKSFVKRKLMSEFYERVNIERVIVKDPVLKPRLYMFLLKPHFIRYENSPFSP